MDTRGAMTEDEEEVEACDDETTYRTLGGTRVVSNTRFLTARKLDLRLTNDGGHSHYLLTSCSGSHTTGLPNRQEYTGRHLRTK